MATRWTREEDALIESASHDSWMCGGRRGKAARLRVVSEKIGRSYAAVRKRASRTRQRSYRFTWNAQEEWSAATGEQLPWMAQWGYELKRRLGKLSGGDELKEQLRQIMEANADYFLDSRNTQYREVEDAIGEMEEAQDPVRYARMRDAMKAVEGQPINPGDI